MASRRCFIHCVLILGSLVVASAAVLTSAMADLLSQRELRFSYMLAATRNSEVAVAAMEKALLTKIHKKIARQMFLEEVMTAENLTNVSEVFYPV